MEVAGGVILRLSANSNTVQDTFNLCLGEFGEIGDSEEKLADPVQQGESVVSNLFILDHDQSPTPIIPMPHFQFPIPLFDFLTTVSLLRSSLPLATTHSPLFCGNPINLHVLMVL